MRTAARVDANQGEIVAALRGIPGCKVAITSALGHGFPDLAVGWMGANYLIELKDPGQPPSKRRLTPDEGRFHAQWSGQVDIAETFEDCLIILGISDEPPPF
jgi:hypothetical protein